MNKKLRQEYCGLLGYRPQWLQRFASVQSFTFFASAIVAIQGIYLGYFIGIITTIEKRFKLPSTSSGALLSYYDIGHSISVLIVGHYGFWFHKPKWIGIGAFVSCLGCFGLALPHIIFGGYGNDQKFDIGEDGSSSHNAGSFCLTNSSYSNGASNLVGSSIYLVENTTELSSTNSDNEIAYNILVIFQLICGIASSPFTTLTYVYIDDNATKKQSPFYLGLVICSLYYIFYIHFIITTLGLMTAMWAFGPALGFGLAAICTQTFVTLNCTLN